MTPNPSPDELARALVAIEHAGQITAAKTTAAGEAGAARAFELGMVVRAAMRATAQLGEFERGLAAGAPSAAGRLRILADIAAVSFAKVVVDGTAQVMLADMGLRKDQ
jgi:hypothetical protein